MKIKDEVIPAGPQEGESKLATAGMRVKILKLAMSTGGWTAQSSLLGA